MNFKALIVVIAFASSLLTNAHAIPVSASTVSLITDGTDYAGLFGLAGADLSGKLITTTFSADIDASNVYGSDTYALQGFTSAAPVKWSATIDGVTYEDTTTGDYFSSTLFNGLSTNNPNMVEDWLSSGMQGVNNAGITLYGTFHAYSDVSAFVGASNDITAPHAHTISPDDAADGWFQIYDQNTFYLNIHATPIAVALNGPLPAEVPEPGALLLMMAGMALLAASRGKHRSHM